MVSYFTQNKFLFGLMSIAFIFIWSYVAYQIGKNSTKLLRDIALANFIPIIFVSIQFLIIIYSKVVNTYKPAIFSQLYFSASSILVTSLFSFNEEMIVVISFVFMMSVFSFWFLKGKVDG